MERKVKNSILELIDGDITEMDTNAIVNAANSHLQHGGGVAGAIVRKGGWIIQEESNKIGYVPVGEAAITTAGKLKAKYIIHAVGPVWRGGRGNEEEKLKNATLNSLNLADRENLRSITFPAISAGIFGFPADRCARIMLSTAIEYLNGETSLERLVFCLYGKSSFEVFQKELELQLPG
jgi:O-acetyl-ADP-ribose deacetylase (regulator of RNase III)